MSTVIIKASVGKKGTNKVEDVFPIQILLNKFLIPGCLKPTAALVVDGIVGNKTIGAIKDFQRRILGFSNPDGRIDPGGKTLMGLHGPLIWAKPLKEDTTREWAIALRSIDSGKVEFKLVNRATGVGHKLVIRNPGISAVSVSKSFSEKWVSFQTFLATGFDDFNNTSASFSKAGSSGGYKMSIGWLGGVPVAPYPGPSFSQICPAVPQPYPSGMFAQPKLLGCDIGSGSSQLGTAKVDKTYSQIYEIHTPPVPTPYPTSPLWSPPATLKVLLLSP